MNNNINRMNKELAEECMAFVQRTHNDFSLREKIKNGQDDDIELIRRLSLPRQMNRIRISNDALNICLEKEILPFDYFILTKAQCKRKCGNFFSSYGTTIEECHRLGNYVTSDYNLPNASMLLKMYELYDNNPDARLSKYRDILNSQSIDIITLEEKQKIKDANLEKHGDVNDRDELCSSKIEFVDLWLTPQIVIDDFFKTTKLSRSKCLDPCAADGRWLKGKGYSIDIIPMKKGVEKKDFLSMTKDEIPNGIKTIVGNLPFSLLDEFVNKSLELVNDCYFLVNGDTILKHFPENIEHIYIFTGIEGNQKDNRSRCEFDVPFLIKSALWCCIVHITRKKQPKWVVEKDLSNKERRDGYHVALGKNVFIKSDVKVDENTRITKIPVTSCIKWKGGKKIVIDGEEIDLKKFTNV